MQLMIVLLLFAAGALAADPHTLQWPDTYTISGTISLPYAEITEPFQAIMDIGAKMGRMNINNGEVTLIYRGDDGDYGTLYKTVPVTMNDTYNVMTCYALAGSSDQPVLPQTVLPDPTLYKYVADMKYADQDSMLYISSFTENTKNNNYTLIVTTDMKPLILSFLGFDRLFGSHYDEYVVTYDNVSFDKPDASNFIVASKDSCKTSFPGPGRTHPMTESIFHELMGPGSFEERTQHVQDAFESFKSRYGKSYESHVHEAERKHHFHHNYRFVKAMGNKRSSFTVELNHLADLSDAEMKRMRGYKNSGINSEFVYTSSVSANDIPDYVNWWLKGAVTPVKDQAICGSCWSFGTTGTLEGSLFIKTGNLVALSEQAFVDCSWGQGNNGCDGGESERAFEWLLLGRCLPTEATYPYMMQDSTCKDKTATCGVRISKYYNVMSTNVTDLKVKIFERGPISIAIDASHRSFSFYANGVYKEPKCGNTPNDLDHQVLAVGYGDVNGDEYVIVKNSWSTHWGNDGYVLMSTDNNQCGIATDGSFADVM
ncbi:PREDICTED: digestive cysteine proteinase 1-like [Amphimedon queenslandica]|uniref:Counting factor associated protein D n=1 Tax=Amphimedon queenslandica TaxID=400682 RepID=A0A1X7UHQ8_AMPQE|nr:PREDICTED: digestive cysteine proteinase 1-like [Amphimedon queenslandica]|eukprot:XP_003387854.1 PREDICTED: digestive cysteine proteinase 1-like [Amphimedon queenslandica]